jgi:hypothetical protein
VDHTLRVYSNSFKQSLYLLGSLGFVAVGLPMLSDPKGSRRHATYGGRLPHRWFLRIVRRRLSLFTRARSTFATPAAAGGRARLDV